MTLQQLEQLAQSLRATTISHIALAGKDWSVRMTTSATPPVLPSPDATPPLTPVHSPAPGRVFLRHPLLEQNFIAPGAPVKTGNVLALIKMGVAYLPVLSPVSGRLISLSISDGDSVEFATQIAQIQSDSPVHPGL
ncbi:acetyl-CoA carboxylase biotin carboxyl carrier protein [Phytobacter sp. V91]|uniref:acetyl-CoA carboxylase biotin carboxyl carrier protein n=1 Tax=Phytobacter sp. V91 TaxID=3369425 RepID=UPI003F5F3D99